MELQPTCKIYLSTRADGPQFKHDCSECQFICRVVWEDKDADFYVCKGSYQTSLIFRVGDDGPEYASYAYSNAQEFSQRSTEGLINKDVRVRQHYVNLLHMLHAATMICQIF